MKRIALLLTVLSLNAIAVDESRYFTRPLSCPLRYSSLSNIRDQLQMLVSSLGNGCTQNNQQAINQLNSSVSNLEGIVTTFSKYKDNSSTDISTNAQYAKNVGQILGGINLIASADACFYDIKSRGFLPVLSDVIMSVSQLGLLIPNATGQAAAAGGYIAGSGIKIIHQLVKKKFNFDKPEERRAFIQLNCAFFDNRRIMEESGIFNPESEDFRSELLDELKRERIDLLRSQKKYEKLALNLDDSLGAAISQIPSAKERGIDPRLSRKFDEIQQTLGSRPANISEKLRQVQFLSERIEELLTGVRNLTLDEKLESSRKLLVQNMEKISPDLASGGKAWTNNIDEYEFNIRGPLFAFLVPVSASLKRELSMMEAEIAVQDPQLSKNISNIRLEMKEMENNNWVTSMRLNSVEAKIASFERIHRDDMFSEKDEGTSNEVELLDYYRKLQSSILGKEGRDYLKNALKVSYHMQDGLSRQLELLSQARSKPEICSAAEKTRFAWAQYRFKVGEAHDFVATNLDLYRSSFRIGKEKLKRATRNVLEQIDSVLAVKEGRTPIKDSVGDLMRDVQSQVKDVELKLKSSGCF